MKKLILSAAAALFFMTAEAQSDTVKFGVKAGVQFTNFNVNDDIEWDGKTGFYVGGLVDLPLIGSFHLQPELLYSMEGAEHETAGDWGISYLRVPVMAKYYIVQGLSLQAGPEFAFKIGTEDDAVDEVTKSFDFGIGLGAAYDLPIGLMFDLRYNFGVNDIYDGPTDGSKVQNRGFQVGLGYRF